ALIAWGIPQLARKDSIVSPILMRVVGGESPAEEFSLKLGPGTRITGVTTPARSSSQMMELVWRDRESYAKLPAEQRLPNREGQTVEIAPELVQNVSPGPE